MSLVRSHGVYASCDSAFACTRMRRTDETRQCRCIHGAEPPAARHWPHRPARSALIKRAGRRAEVNVVWYVVRALPVPLSMFRLRAVSWVPVRYVLRSLFEIHIATHASLQYAEHVRQVCTRTGCG